MRSRPITPLGLSGVVKMKFKTWVHLVSKTHWATRWRQLLLGCASSLASSQLNPMSFKSFRIMFCQFFRGLPGFLFMLLRFQFKAWFGIRQSSILITCPSRLSLFFFIPVLFLTSTLLTLSYHFIPNNRRWSLWYCCFQCLHMFDCQWPQFCTVHRAGFKGGQTAQGLHN